MIYRDNKFQYHPALHIIQLYLTHVQTMLQLLKQITAAGVVSKSVAMIDCAIIIVYTACLG